MRSVCKRVETFVMYQEFVVCNVPRNCITNAENSTIFYFKSVSTWQEDLLRMHEAHKDSWDMTHCKRIKTKLNAMSAIRQRAL